MKPLYQHEGAMLFHGDCREVIAAMPECFRVDHTISDAPYDDNTSKNARTLKGATNNRKCVSTEGKGKSRFIPFDGVNPESVASLLLPVTNRWAIIFCALEQLGEYKAAAAKSWVRAGVWVRRGGAPQFTGDRPGQGAEGVAIMHRPGRKRWNNGGHPALWDCMRAPTGFEPGATERVHPTQKPVNLMMDLIEQFTDPGETILDPFCGSGTTGIACMRLGRKFVGIEKDGKFAALAAQRLGAESRGSTLHAALSGQASLFEARR